MKLKYLSFEQPIGEFAISVMTIKDILNISVIERREFDQVSLDSVGGPQREASINRINEIAKYSETSDATFPTPILLALSEGSYQIDDDYITLDDFSTKASVVDGQHRLLGLAKSKFSNEFTLPVVFVLDATDEQKALIFAIINGKQTRVAASVIYDLFNVVEGRNPFKTAHEIARALNQDENSPFYRRLKMLGKKVKGTNETLSQGTFVTQLVKLISNNPADDFNKARSNQPIPVRPNCIFNSYFVDNNDEVILKILYNLFKALKTTFPEEWENPQIYILSKTTGYTGIIKALPELYKKGQEQKDLSFDYFLQVFSKLKEIMQTEQLQFVSDTYNPNSIGENKLKDKIIDALKATQ
jgi:DGQHR domain-containing protein